MSGESHKHSVAKYPEVCEECWSTQQMSLEWVRMMMRDGEELAWVCAECGHAHLSAEKDDCEGC